MWAPPRDFCQREIKMELHPTGEITQSALKSVVQLLISDAEKHVCIFVNFVSEATTYSASLEKLLAKELVRVGVLTINGEMDKHGNFAFIRLFTSRVHLRDFNPRCLVATAAGNTGIDKPKCKMVLRLGIPRTIIEMLQERSTSQCPFRPTKKGTAL